MPEITITRDNQQITGTYTNVTCEPITDEQGNVAGCGLFVRLTYLDRFGEANTVKLQVDPTSNLASHPKAVAIATAIDDAIQALAQAKFGN